MIDSQQHWAFDDDNHDESFSFYDDGEIWTKDGNWDRGKIVTLKLDCNNWIVTIFFYKLTISL